MIGESSQIHLQFLQLSPGMSPSCHPVTPQISSNNCNGTYFPTIDYSKGPELINCSLIVHYFNCLPSSCSLQSFLLHDLSIHQNDSTTIDRESLKMLFLGRIPEALPWHVTWTIRPQFLRVHKCNYLCLAFSLWIWPEIRQSRPQTCHRAQAPASSPISNGVLYELECSLKCMRHDT